jgi:hypothetical protein
MQTMEFRHIDTLDGVTLEFYLNDEAHAALSGGNVITSDSLGEFPIVKQRMEDRDSKPYDLDTDIFGQPRLREPGSVIPGPFAKLNKGRNEIHFRSGSVARGFGYKPSAIRTINQDNRVVLTYASN